MKYLTTFVVAGWLFVPGSYWNVAAAECSNPITTKEILRCETAKLKSVEKSLAEFRREIDQVLTEKKDQKFISLAHSAWLAYREKHCAVAALLYEDGSMEPTMMTSCMLGVTEQRLKDLHVIFDPWLRGQEQKKR